MSGEVYIARSADGTRVTALVPCDVDPAAAAAWEESYRAFLGDLHPGTVLRVVHA